MKTIWLLFIICITFTGYAQKKVVAVSLFGRADGISVEEAENVRAKVMKGLEETGYLTVKDLTSIIPVPHGHGANVVNDRNVKILKSLHISHIIQGEVTAFTRNKGYYNNGETYYEVLVTYDLTVYDIDTKWTTYRSSFTERGTGDSEMAAIISFTRALDDMKYNMRNFVEEKFDVLKIIEIKSTREGAVREVCTNLGYRYDNGIALKNMTFSVYILDQFYSGRKSRRSIGTLKVIKVLNDTVSLCEIQSRGKEIKKFFDEGQTLFITIRPTDAVFDIFDTQNTFNSKKQLPFSIKTFTSMTYMKQLFATLFFVFSFNLGFSQALELQDAVSSKTLALGVTAHKEKEYSQAMDLYEKAYRETNIFDFYNTIYNRIVLCLDIDNYEEASIFISLVLEDTSDMERADIAMFKSAAACLYTKTNQFNKVEAYHLEALEGFSATIGNTHKRYVSELNRLIDFYVTSSSFEKVEPLLLYSLPLTESLWDKDKDKHFVMLLLNASQYYNSAGNFEKSTVYLHQSIKLMTNNKNLDPHGTIAPTLKIVADKQQQLSAIFRTQIYAPISSDQPDLTSFEQALKMVKSNYGIEHPFYMLELRNLVSVYELENRHKALDSLLSEAIKIEKTNRGIHTENYTYLLERLAKVSAITNKERAIVLTKEVLNRKKISYGKYNLKSNEELSNLASLYSEREQDSDIDSAAYYYQQIFEVIRSEVKTKFNFMPEADRELLFKRFTPDMDLMVLFSWTKINSRLALAGLAYDKELFSKGLLLQSAQRIQQSIVNSQDTLLIEEWDRLRTLKKEQIRIEARSSDFKELNQIAGQIKVVERKVLLHSQAYRESLVDLDIRWTAVQKALQANDVAIELIAYPWDNTKMYCALILRPNYKYPQMVLLTEGTAITKALQKSPQDAKYLYPLIWKPLERYLEGVQTIYLAPTGVLHNVSFAGMKTDNGYLSDHFAIHNMLSTKDLISLKDKTTVVRQANDALLMGGADFNLPNDELASLDAGKVDGQNLTRGELDELDPTRGQGFDYLPGSKKEVEQIDQLLTQSQCSTALFTDKYATESQFKASIVRQAPDVIHISTHGFYFPDAKPHSENKYRTAEKPLLRSGLAFAGANSVWSGKQVSDLTDDGILTAYEISNLDLTNTKLVVLSACETGLGDIVGNEGVYGLQRAFRLAGVQSLIVSLWKVSDVETVAFMTDFYAQWTKKMSVKDAFTKAQNKMKMQYVDQPEKWAGFVLVE